MSLLNAAVLNLEPAGKVQQFQNVWLQALQFGRHAHCPQCQILMEVELELQMV
jgi:hypothetical protein